MLRIMKAIQQTNKSISNKRVFVGLSGGVDSAVSAALLKKAGYDVTGVFIKVCQPDWIACNWREERRDAMRVAAHLGIDFVTLDCVQEYKKGVIDYMIKEYESGRTPNPDVMCNKTVKFGAFYNWAMKNGADFVATGHYARISTCGDGRKCLLKGSDPNKDQSYFLWAIKRDQLDNVLFPIGDIQKNEVRKLAKKFGLPNAEKKDSQGLCFIGKIDLKDFLRHYVRTEKGNVLDENGEVVGSHDGALFFTIGERHGFTISKKTPNDLPLYVIDKDMAMNTITVSQKSSGKLSGATQLVRITEVNWTSGNPFDDLKLKQNEALGARARYREALQNARISSSSIAYTDVKFDEPQDTLASGQSLVLYHGDVCLGGGIIE